MAFSTQDVDEASEDHTLWRAVDLDIRADIHRSVSSGVTEQAFVTISRTVGGAVADHTDATNRVMVNFSGYGVFG